MEIKNKKLSIVVPIFNEEIRLKKNLIKIRNFIKNRNIEVILINDGSTDRSKKIIEEFIKKNKKIKIISLNNNLGKGGALKYGILKINNKFILTMDLDLSVNISQVYDWFKQKYVQTNCTVYFGSRNHEKSIIQYKLYRKLIGVTLNLITKFLLNIKIKDTQCGYKLYLNNSAKFLFSRITRTGYEHDIELAIIAQNKNINIKELPVKWKHKNGSKVNVITDSIKFLVGIIKLKIKYYKKL